MNNKKWPIYLNIFVFLSIVLIVFFIYFQNQKVLNTKEQQNQLESFKNLEEPPILNVQNIKNTEENPVLLEETLKLFNQEESSNDQNGFLENLDLPKPPLLP